MFDELFGPLFTTEWGRRLGWGALATVVFLIILIAILSIYHWRRDYQLAHKPMKSSEIGPQNVNVDELIASIPQDHLFGYSGATESLPITSLQLKLVGVVKAEPEKFSRVIISEGGKSGKVYRVGDTLTGGVKINSITEDGVILENEGRFEKLPLRRAPLQFQGMPKPLLPNKEMQEE